MKKKIQTIRKKRRVRKKTKRISDKNETIYKKNISIKDFSNELYSYFEGFLIGPLLSFLGYLKIYPLNDKNTFNHIIKNILIDQQFIFNNNLTERGEFFFKRFASYGVTTSYLETLNQLDNILLNILAAIGAVFLAL